jgi:PKD domain
MLGRPHHCPRGRTPPLNARNNRLEIVRALSHGQIDRRDLLRWGLVTAGGLIAPIGGLSPFVGGSARGDGGSTGTVFSPGTAGLAFTQPMLRLEVQPKKPISSLSPLPTAECNDTLKPVDPALGGGQGPIEGRPPGPDWLTSGGTSSIRSRALTYAWTQTVLGTCSALACPPVTLSNPAAATPTFKAPLNTRGKSTVITFSLKVTNTSLLTSTASLVNITVNSVVAPIANAGPNQSVLAGSKVQLDASASLDPNGLPITYLWTPGGGVTLSRETVVNPTFTAPNSNERFDTNLTVNNGFLTSPTTKVTVNVVTVPDTIAITAVIYRISKHRLDVTATSAVATANPTLPPVLSLVGVGPNGTNLTFAYAGAGSYTVSVSGVAEPASVTITGSAGGSASSPVTLRLN